MNIEERQKRVEFYSKNLRPGLIMYKDDNAKELFKLKNIILDGFIFEIKMEHTGITMTKTFSFEEIEKGDWKYNELFTFMTNPNYVPPIYSIEKIRKNMKTAVEFLNKNTNQQTKLFNMIDKNDEKINKSLAKFKFKSEVENE